MCVVCAAFGVPSAVVNQALPTHCLAVGAKDLMIPKLSGFDLLKRLRQDPQLAALVVIMVTSENELDHMVAALEAGANEYVMKPFTKDILLEKLRLAGVHP